MVKGLVLGAVAFGVVMLAERQFAAVSKDVAHYDAIRAMSGDPPLYRQLLNMATDWVVGYGATRGLKPADIVTDFTRDAVRYAIMRTM